MAGIFLKYLNNKSIERNLLIFLTPFWPHGTKLKVQLKYNMYFMIRSTHIWLKDCKKVKLILKLTCI
ncbi:MAG: hypothetical protein JG780_1148 [Thermosipho sp. (in: Bacteria)]|jgi:hypothetical protein|nr:hypothetical protein [Thermosipho sp. (in: thermotogales)]